VISAAAMSFTRDRDRDRDRDRRVTAQGKWGITHSVLTDGLTFETLAEGMAIESGMYPLFNKNQAA